MPNSRKIGTEPDFARAPPTNQALSLFFGYHKQFPMTPSTPTPLVAVIMGSKSDWETMKNASETLARFGVPHDSRVLSAHRTPQAATEFAATASSRGLKVVIAAAGGAAHLAGVLAAHTLLPVLGVPMESQMLRGMDSLLSTVQMPAGIPVGTLAIGKAGAINAALLAIDFLALQRPDLEEKLVAFRKELAVTILNQTH